MDSRMKVQYKYFQTFQMVLSCVGGLKIIRLNLNLLS